MPHTGGLSLEAVQEIKRLCARGDVLADAEEFEQALDEYEQAWKLIPEPQSMHAVSTLVLAAISDARFLSGNIEGAKIALEAVFVRQEATGNPFLHLRYGQVLMDLGQLDRAADQLLRAYSSGGREIFDDENRKYLDFLRTRAHIEDSSD